MAAINEDYSRTLNVPAMFPQAEECSEADIIHMAISYTQQVCEEFNANKEYELIKQALHAYKIDSQQAKELNDIDKTIHDGSDFLL